MKYWHGLVTGILCFGTWVTPFIVVSLISPILFNISSKVDIIGSIASMVVSFLGMVVLFYKWCVYLENLEEEFVPPITKW